MYGGDGGMAMGFSLGPSRGGLGWTRGGADRLERGRRLTQLEQAFLLAAESTPYGETGATRYINPSSDFLAIYFGVSGRSAAALAVECSDGPHGVTPE